jgi:protein-L-isoaspartate(D-aspartate) O-methyltransferase
VRDRVGFHGLDRYSLFTSIRTVLGHLDQVDPRAARAARHRYGALTLWQKNPAAYGEAALPLHYVSSEQTVVNLLCAALARRIERAQRDGEPYFDAAQDARCIAHAELFYRSLYYGRATWNLRDGYMFDTLRSLLAFYGAGSKGIVWAHNSHVGDVTATEMGARGDHNLGAICRAAFGEDTYIVGFGTDHGTVAVADRWDAPLQRMPLAPSIEGSYERVFHESGVPAFTLPLANPRRPSVRDELAPALLERAVGIVSSPDMGRLSQYFHAVLPRQFDELIWFDETSAIDPLGTTEGSRAGGMESLDL